MEDMKTGEIAPHFHFPVETLASSVEHEIWFTRGDAAMAWIRSNNEMF